MQGEGDVGKHLERLMHVPSMAGLSTRRVEDSELVPLASNVQTV
jgi:hypothetical protein